MRVIKENLNISKKDLRYLSLASSLAFDNSKCRRKHAAVIVKGGSVLSTGFNKDKNHPTIVSEEHIKTHCSTHAEIDALNRVGSADGATMYIARVSRSGATRNSRPCTRCYEAITRAGIKKIIYTIEEE